MTGVEMEVVVVVVVMVVVMGGSQRWVAAVAVGRGHLPCRGLKTPRRREHHDARRLEWIAVRE